MSENVSTNNDQWSFDLSRIGTWFYFLIIGFPISIILLLVDSIYMPFTDKPNFIHNLSKYSMTYNGGSPQVEYYTRTPAQKVLLGFAGFVMGTIILAFSLILSIFGAFKQAAELQENIILIVFPAIQKSNQQIENSEMATQTTSTEKEPNKICPACGESNLFSAVFCIDCGSSLPAKNM